MHQAFSRIVGIFGALSVSSTAACAGIPTSTAVSILTSPPGAVDSVVKGVVNFSQQRRTGAPVVIRVRVSGLVPRSIHGFHIHQLGDLTSGCNSAGGHFNPFGRSHGGPLDLERHAGDWGTGSADENGYIDATSVDSGISLVPGSPMNVVGRSVVLHAQEDDLGAGGHADSKTTGHAGARIGCGVIGLGLDTEEMM